MPTGLNGMCAFCGTFTVVMDYNGFMLCETCTEKAKQLVSKELMKLVAPYLSKLRRDIKTMSEQKKTGSE